MNTNKVGIKKALVLLLTFLLTISLASTSIAFAGNEPTNELQGEAKMPEVPGQPENVVQYNKTDVVPVAETEKVLSGEPALFAYQNMTMLFNSTMNCNLVITSEPSANQKIFALTLDPNQTMTLTMNFGSDPLQNEQERDKNLNFYTSIEPNATVELKAQLKLYINQTKLTEELGWEVNPEKLTWMFWNGTQNQWIKVPSFIDQNGYLTCNTDHFSIWTVGENEEQTAAFTDMTLVYSTIGVVLALVTAIAIVVFHKRK